MTKSSDKTGLWKDGEPQAFGTSLEQSAEEYLQVIKSVLKNSAFDRLGRCLR